MSLTSKPKKIPRLLYSKDTLREALAAIKAGMPINTASMKYHIPRSTLHNKKTAKYADKRPGPDTVLTTAEENSLVQWIFDCSKLGMPVSKQHLLNSVALLVKILNRENPFANGRPGRHWYQSFLRRHPNVSDKIAENAMFARSSPSETGIKQWFSNVRLYFEQKKLLNIHPSRIFTTETVLLMSPDASEDKENLSVQVAGNAAGQLAPSMVLFTYQRIPGKIYERMPQGWICGKSENGCMTSENLYEYITKCFYPWLVEINLDFPVILFLDGRISHLTLSLTDFCLRNKIELVALHPNASQMLQPLDVTMFPSLKVAWREALANYRLETKAVNLLKENVAPLLNSVFNALDVKQILTSGFEKCGLYPMSDNIINYTKIPKVVEKVKTERIEFTPFSPQGMFAPVVEPSITNAQFLHFLEQTLDADIIQTFKNVSEYNEWNGRIEDTGLFYLWRKMSNLCKTDGDNLNSQQNIVNTKYDTIQVNVNETENSNLIETKSECMELIIEDPLKICVTEMRES